MANKIKPKRSFSANSVPSGLESGELAVNVTDAKVWCGDQSGTGITLIASLSLGDQTGTLGIANGGTGETTANAALNALIPSQSGNSGKFLTTDGQDTSWDTISISATPAGSNQDLQFNDNGVLGAVSNWDYDSSQYKMAVGHQGWYTALQVSGLANVASNLVEFSSSSANVFTIYNTNNYWGTVTINKLLYLNGQGELRLNDADNSNYVAIRSPATVTSNYTLNLPSATGSSGQVLSTDGSGNLSWASSGTAIPSGCIQIYGGSSAPSGWLICDGSAVSRTTYAALFTAIGTTYGVGNGSTTFNLPDCRGRAVIGVGQGSGLTNRTLAATTGTETHTLALSETPSHNHNGLTGYMSANTTHNHSLSTTLGVMQYGFANLGGGYQGALAGTQPYSHTYSISSTNTDHYHTINAAGGGGSHNNMQPSIALNYIIKT